jgi:hypothetical protein
MRKASRSSRLQSSWLLPNFIAGQRRSVWDAREKIVNVLPIDAPGARFDAFTGAPCGKLSGQRHRDEIVYAGPLVGREFLEFLKE